MSLTTNQKQHILEAHEALKNRGMVFLAGRENGKTRIATRLQELKPVASGPGRFTLRARHEEDNEIEFVTNIFYGRSDKVTPYTFMRQILASQGIKPGYGFWEVTKSFENMLVENYERGRVIALAIDNAELLPERTYTVLKMLNEMRRNKKDIGCAVLVSGRFEKMRMPIPFLKRCTEIQVGPITATSEIAQLIETHWPGEASGFTEEALRRVKSQCETTLEIREAISRIVRKKRVLAMDEVNLELVNLALAA